MLSKFLLDNSSFSAPPPDNYCIVPKYIQKVTQNDHPINFLKPRTATSGHSYNLRASDNNRNIVYVDRSCCRTLRSGSFISFASKYVNM